jgi:arabinogalactan endo-1,4-beta-galactosidase
MTGATIEGNFPLEIRGRQNLDKLSEADFWIDPAKKRKPSAIAFEAFKAMRSRTLANERN